MSYAEEIRKLALTVATLGRPDKERFFRHLFEALPEGSREHYLEYCFKLVYRTKWKKLNRYLDGLFNRDPDLTPKVAAQHLKYYAKIPEAMMPLLLKLARRAKDRVLKRKKRRSKKDA